MAAHSYFEQLVKPISADSPCGESIEDTQLLASFDAYRVFGQSTPLDGVSDWREIKSKSLEALAVCKDFRLLAHLAAAALRIDSLPAFCAIARVAEEWITNHWSAVHPRLDDDAILRKNALNGLGDRMAIIDALRRLPLVTNPQLGSYSLRDIDIATGQWTPPESESRVINEAEINAAFLAAPLEQLTTLSDEIRAAIAALKSVDAKMRNECGSDSAPSLDDLLVQLVKAERLLGTQISLRVGADPAAEIASDGAAQSGGQAGALISVGSIKSRQDAIRALDAVASFFRQNEPSSPVPLFIERAKRLVAKDFLEVLADIAPDALDQAKAASGIRNE